MIIRLIIVLGVLFSVSLTFPDSIKGSSGYLAFMTAAFAAEAPKKQEKFYQLSAGSGTCVDLKSGKEDPDSNMAQPAKKICNARLRTQVWTFVDAGDGLVQIQSAQSRKCLTVSGASLKEEARVHQWDCMKEYLFQKWRVSTLKDGKKILSSQGSGKCLSIAAQTKVGLAEGSTIQDNCDGVNPNQIWTFNEVALPPELSALAADAAMASSIASRPRISHDYHRPEPLMTPDERDKYMISKSVPAVASGIGLLGRIHSSEKAYQLDRDRIKLGSSIPLALQGDVKKEIRRFRRISRGSGWVSFAGLMGMLFIREKEKEALLDEFLSSDSKSKVIPDQSRSDQPGSRPEPLRMPGFDAPSAILGR